MINLLKSIPLIPVYIIIGICWFFVTMFIAVRGLVEMVLDYLLAVKR